jgi:hypothetical protein
MILETQHVKWKRALTCRRSGVEESLLPEGGAVCNAAVLIFVALGDAALLLLHERGRRAGLVAPALAKRLGAAVQTHPGQVHEQRVADLRVKGRRSVHAIICVCVCGSGVIDGRRIIEGNCSDLRARHLPLVIARLMLSFN